MYSQYRDSFWNKIRMQNSDMNRSYNRDSGRVESSADTEWDLSQIELQEERSPQSIPTIELEDEDEVDAGSVHVVHNIPINVERSTPTALAVDPEIRLARRSIHEYRGIFPGTARSVVQEGATVSPTPSGIILNRVYHKNPTPLKDNYFSIMDTPPSPGALPAAVIFGDRPVSTEPKIVMTANHYEKRTIRRSFDKSRTVTSGKASRQAKNNGPYKLLGVIDLEPDTESDATLSCTQSVAGDEPKLLGLHACRDLGAPTNSALLASSSTPLSIKDVGNKQLTIEIDEDEIQEEDTRMELSDEECDEPTFEHHSHDQPMPGSSKDNADVKQQMDHCTLMGSDTSSTAQMNPSSMANSFWDVSSSGCMKKNNDHASTSSNRGTKCTEFDLMLEKINQQVPAMSQQDRIEHWRVTKEDLLCSIPTVAEIESGTSVKRPMDEPIHISSSDSSSDSETSDSPSLLRERQLREKYKKRRMAVDALGVALGNPSPSLLLSEELDFRRSQLNPEIDKGPSSMIQVRKHYYKLPTRFNPAAEENEPSGKSSADPYATFLKDEKEKEKFTGYLRRNPSYRPNLQSPMRHLPVGEGNKVAVVVLSPLKLQNVEVNSNPNNSTTSRSTAESERPKSADRISHYGKSRTKAKSVVPVSRKLRYKVRKSQLKKKKSIMVVSANLRSYRRLVMKAGYSLRSGKVRKKPSFVNLINSSKQNREQKLESKITAQSEREPKAVQSIRRVKPVPVEQSSRVSVDSAVSSSTSAEQNKRRDAPEVVELPPCPAPSELRTMKNPLSRDNGEVQMIFYAGNVLIVVQQELISFWECSKLASLLGLQQELQPLGQLKRAQSDSLVDPTNLNRLGFNEDEAFYLEPRARNLDEDDARLCPLASIYVNCYFVGVSEENKDTPGLRMKSLQLDSVRSEISEILFTPLPRSRYFIICWHELLAENEHRTGLCKYSLTPDLETLASIREFPTVTQKIVSLKCLDGERLIGLGSTTVTIWNYDNGCLEFTVDLKMEIQTSLATFVHSEQGDSALFLIQMCPSSGGNPARKTIKILAINMKKRSWHLVQSYDVSLESSCILSESSTLNGPGLHCTTFQSGELLAISLDDLTTCFTNHKRLQGPDCRRITRDNVATREKIFLNSANGRQLVLVSDKSIKLRTIDEYALECR